MKTTILLILTLLQLGCLVRPIVIKPDDVRHENQNARIEAEIVKLAMTGDWLVTRGYHATDNLVSNATGTPISHVGIVNIENQIVIEAEGVGVHTSSLAEFIDKSYRIMIIRPRWRTDENARLAWEKAETLVGENYDFLGTIGFNYPDKYYCSELAISVYNDWYSGKEKFPNVIKPGELYLYGRVIYDSMPRDEI